jgi:hypothetical protein
MTARDLITAALRRLGVVGAGETPQADDVTDALDRLNDLVDAWGTERLTIYQTVRSTWALTPNVATYTIGPSGDCNIARPVWVEDLRFQDTSQSPTLEMPLSPLTTDAWAAVPQKALTSTYPTSYYWTPAYPQATVTFWMIPTSSTLQGVIYVPTAVTEFGLNDTISLPPGYRRALRDNLAVELAAEFTVQPAPTLLQSAQLSKADLKRANIELRDLSVDVMWRPRHGRYNIFSDTGA